MADEQLVRCAVCRDLLTRTEEKPSPDGDIHLEFYSCKGCGRKLMLVWELTGKLAGADVRTFVEQEAVMRGAFFPTDVLPNRFRR